MSCVSKERKSALKATPVHPFYARRNANDTAHWINAGDLVEGEQIETQDGRWVAVQSVTPVQGLSVVYNFTAEEDGDYFVGDEGLLVHNGSASPIIFPPGTVFLIQRIQLAFTHILLPGVRR